MTLQEKEVLETIADSDYVIHEIKLRLNACKDCDDYFSYKGNSYCIQKEGKK